jgi:hypothetical protein
VVQVPGSRRIGGSKPPSTGPHTKWLLVRADSRTCPVAGRRHMIDNVEANHAVELERTDGRIPLPSLAGLV